jgi:hypothetical protein
LKNPGADASDRLVENNVFLPKNGCSITVADEIHPFNARKEGMA